MAATPVAAGRPPHRVSYLLCAERALPCPASRFPDSLVEIPDAVTVMDPFHVVRLAGDALDRCRRRVQLAIHGHRGFRDDPLYKSRRTLHTGADLLTDKQSDRLRALFVDDAHVEVEATWGVYQRMIAAYRHEDRQRGRELMEKLITDLSAGVPKVLTELTTYYRDVFCVQSGATKDLINAELRPEIEAMAARDAPERTLRRIDSILECRTALEGNVAPLLAMESLMIGLAASV